MTRRAHGVGYFYGPGVDVVGLAGFCLSTSRWSYGYAESFSRHASAFDRSIYFIPRSGKSLQGVPGSASSCVHAVVDYLFASSDALALLAARCRHLRTCHIRLLPDGKDAFAPAVESCRADYGRFAASNISVPTWLGSSWFSVKWKNGALALTSRSNNGFG